MEEKKILIVDDEEDLLKTIAYRLEIEGYQTVTASSAEEGLEVARKEKPNLILLDIRLPGKDGFHMFKQLKEDRTLRNIPVIFLTAQMIRRDDRRILQANDRIIKPFAPEELLKKIRKHIR